MKILMAAILAQHARVAGATVPQATVAVKRPAVYVCCLCGGPASPNDWRTCADAFCGAATRLKKD